MAIAERVFVLLSKILREQWTFEMAGKCQFEGQGSNSYADETFPPESLDVEGAK